MATIYFKTPLCWVELSADEKGVTALSLLTAVEAKTAQATKSNTDFAGSHQVTQTIHPTTQRILQKAERQLREYFAGRRKAFSLPLHATGTPFRQQVWAKLQRIPYGQTVSYQAVARALGKPKASRAVGQANHHNPIGIIVPCHRVVAADGSLGGYASGLDHKVWLLKLEQQN